MIDTGEPRNVTGHIVSGAAASAVVATGINYNSYKKNEISKKEAVQSSIKLTIQGGVATGSAIATANYIGKGNYIGAMTAFSLGFGGVYAIEKIAEKLNKTKKLEENTEEVGE